ncbi:arginase [Sporomusa sp.]|uniref:arginase n=1 Tax=Sporomusa sp. TaxID=2078658 RepID=UPI002C0C66D7|nr:arginase [Sporomusa sp.]HWR45159.1 arginase [Sporomusa sp.]
MRKITVVGAPMWLGQSEFGTQLGPEAIRSAGLMKYLQSSRIDIIDAGNLDIKIKEPCCRTNDIYCKVRNLEDVRDSVELLASKVSEVVGGGRFPLILGGDHSIAIGSLAGIAKHYRNLGVIWYDAHADSNTVETSPSGNIQGMPLAASIGAGHLDLIEVGGYRNKVKAEHIVLIGVRDIDPGEREFIDKKQIKIFTAEDVHRIGINNVIDETVSYLTSKCDGIHLSYDLDVIDPSDSRGVGTPVDCGIYLEQNIEAMKLLARYNVITSAEFVEVNPLLDKDGRTVAATVALIRALLTN